MRLFGARQQIVIVRAVTLPDKLCAGIQFAPLANTGRRLPQTGSSRRIRRDGDRARSFEVQCEHSKIEDFLAIDKLETHIVKGMSPLAVRPPQFRILDLKFETGDLSDDLVRSRDDRVARRRRPRSLASMLASTTLPSCRCDANRLKRFPIHPLQADRLVNTTGREAGSPVPAKRTLFFSNVRSTPTGSFHSVFSRFAPGPNVANRAVEADLENVSAGPQRLLYVETVRHEHILRPSDVLSVETDAGDSVEPSATSSCS